MLKSSWLISKLSDRIVLPLLVGVNLFQNIIASTEIWVGDAFEMIAVEVEGMNPKYM